MTALIEKIENDDFWQRGRHGCWHRQISPTVRVDFWIASNLFVVKRINKRGEWVTAPNGTHKADIDRALHHAEVLAMREATT